jgi:hypothetical protein
MIRSPQQMWRSVLNKGLGAPTGRASCGLVQRGIDGGELGVELGAQSIHDRDNRQRNARRDQAILDGGRAGLVSQECSERFHASYKRRRLLSPT